MKDDYYTKVLWGSFEEANKSIWTTKSCYYQIRIKIENVSHREIFQDIVEGLTKKGHRPQVSGSSAVVQGIERLDDGLLRAHSDSRKGGIPSGF